MLARENSGRSVRPSAIFFHKAVLGGNMNSSRMAAALPPSIATFSTGSFQDGDGARK